MSTMSNTVDTKLIVQQPIASQLGGDVTNQDGGTVVSLTRFQLFVQGDIQKGDAAKQYRRAIITDAVRQAFQGNADDIKQAATLAQGKTKISKAYHAGFVTLLTADSDASCLVKVPYKGKLANEANKEARDIIEGRTLHSVNTFIAAFDAVMDAKPVRKAKDAPTDSASASAEASDTDSASKPPSAPGAPIEATDTGLTMADMVRVVANALRTGMLDAESHNVLFEAVEEWTVAEELAEALRTMGNVLGVEFTEQASA